MQIVIDIPEESYKATCNGCMLPPDVENVVNAIRQGIPLPKVHGKIWEENDIKRSIKNDYQLVTILTGLKMVKPIIEAEKEDNG